MSMYNLTLRIEHAAYKNSIGGGFPSTWQTTLASSSRPTPIPWPWRPHTGMSVTKIQVMRRTWLTRDEETRNELTFHVERNLGAGARAGAVGGLADVGPGGRAVHALDHQGALVDHDAAARVRQQFLPLKCGQKSALVLSEKLGASSPLFPFETSFKEETLQSNFKSDV